MRNQPRRDRVHERRPVSRAWVHGYRQYVELRISVGARIRTVATLAAPGPLCLDQKLTWRQPRPSRRFLGTHWPLRFLALQLDLHQNRFFVIVEGEIERSIASRSDISPPLQSSDDVGCEGCFCDNAANPRSVRSLARSIASRMISASVLSFFSIAWIENSERRNRNTARLCSIASPPRSVFTSSREAMISAAPDRFWVYLPASAESSKRHPCLRAGDRPLPAYESDWS